MKTRLVRFTALFAGVLLCSVLQEIIPSFCDVKPPILLVFACHAGLPAACAAGLFYDALSGSPTGCATLFFALAALRIGPYGSAVVPAAFLFPLWLAVWGSAPTSPLTAPFVSALLSVPLTFLASWAGPRIARHIGLPETGEATV